MEIMKKHNVKKTSQGQMPATMSGASIAATRNTRQREPWPVELHADLNQHEVSQMVRQGNFM